MKVFFIFEGQFGSYAHPPSTQPKSHFADKILRKKVEKVRVARVSQIKSSHPHLMIDPRSREQISESSKRNENNHPLDCPRVCASQTIVNLSFEINKRKSKIKSTLPLLNNFTIEHPFN
jgi:hypothetical protein